MFDFHLNLFRHLLESFYLFCKQMKQLILWHHQVTQDQHSSFCFQQKMSAALRSSVLPLSVVVMPLV